MRRPCAGEAQWFLWGRPARPSLTLESASLRVSAVRHEFPERSSATLQIDESIVICDAPNMRPPPSFSPLTLRIYVATLIADARRPLPAPKRRRRDGDHALCHADGRQVVSVKR